jgi:multidrug efflux pump subunit AcrA (membrane-fusion protein)
MFCVVKFQGVPIKNAFKIPFSAIQFGNNVFTVDENGVLHRHSVEIYNIIGNDAIIKEGLPDSTIVVIQQLPRGVVEGMRINPAFETETSDKIN